MVIYSAYADFFVPHTPDIYELFINLLSSISDIYGLLPYLLLFNNQLASADIFPALQAIMRNVKQHNIRQFAIKFTIMEEIGILLRKCREQKGLSQENIADFLGLNPSSVSKIEMGKTNAKYETICRFCEAMDVTLADVLASEESCGPNSCDFNFNINISSPEALKEYLKVINEYQTYTNM